jgi:hypothetical protein
VRDVVGLYLNPPEHALVLAVDEKSQIQALERTQAPLALVNGHPASRTHDYKRHGTTTLFAALDVQSGRVIGRCMMRHRHQSLPRRRPGNSCAFWRPSTVRPRPISTST